MSEQFPAHRIRGDRVRELREKLGMRQADLAYLCDISPSYLSEIERGTNDRNPSSAVLSRMADVLNTSTDYLMGRTDDPAPPASRAAREEVTAAHANPPPPGWDEAEWERRARELVNIVLDALRREWENSQRRQPES